MPVCAHCGKVIRNLLKTTYCSALCRNRHNYAIWRAKARATGKMWVKAPKRCEHCGDVFQPTCVHHRFCSKSCQRYGADKDQRLPALTAPQVEATYRAALAAIKAQRRRIDEATAWSQAGGWHEHLAKWAPDLSDMGDSNPTSGRGRWKRQAARRDVPV